MRSVRAFDLGMMSSSMPAAEATPATADGQADVGGGDALAAASLFGIVGGLVVGLALVPTIPVVAVGSLIGAGVGVVIAYH